MKKDIMALDDAAIERAFGDILIAPSMTPEMAASAAPSLPGPRSVERLMEPRELIDPLDRFELELGIPDRGSLVRRVADLLTGDGAPPAEPDTVAKVVGLAAALASRLRFDGAVPCHLQPDDADAESLEQQQRDAARERDEAQRHEGGD